MGTKVLKGIYVLKAIDAMKMNQVRIRQIFMHVYDDPYSLWFFFLLSNILANDFDLGRLFMKFMILKRVQPSQTFQAIIFCRTKQQCDQMETYLNMNGKPFLELEQFFLPRTVSACFF